MGRSKQIILQRPSFHRRTTNEPNTPEPLSCVGGNVSVSSCSIQSLHWTSVELDFYLNVRKLVTLVSGDASQSPPRVKADYVNVGDLVVMTVKMSRCLRFDLGWIMVNLNCNHYSIQIIVFGDEYLTLSCNFILFF